MFIFLLDQNERKIFVHSLIHSIQHYLKRFASFIVINTTHPSKRAINRIIFVFIFGVISPSSQCIRCNHCHHLNVCLVFYLYRYVHTSQSYHSNMPANHYDPDDWPMAYLRPTKGSIRLSLVTIPTGDIVDELYLTEKHEW